MTTNSVPYNQRTQWNYVEDASSIIESTKCYHLSYPPSYKSTETEHPQKYIKVATIGTIGKDHFSYGKALFQYFRKDLGIPAGITYAESDFCNYINTKINCLLGCTTDTGRLGEQIYQSLLKYSTATTTQAIAETLCIIDTDIKYYMAQQFPQVQQPVESDSEDTKMNLTNLIVFNPPPETQLEIPQTPGNLHPWNQHSWTKSLGEYGSLFENLNSAAGQTEGNLSTWEQPPAQNLAESASLLTEETAILQPIGSSDKGKQPALAPGEHSNMWTPIPLNITSNTPFINWIMAYQDIAKLEKFSGEKDNAYSWIADAKKAITANGWNDDHTVQALPFFLTGTANSWYQSLAEKPTSFTKFKLTFLQYFSIERDYYTTVQVLNQFIKGLRSSILRSVRPCHLTSLQDTVTLAHDFESAKQEANHTQAINLAINGTSDIDTKITQLSKKLTQKIEGFLAGTTGTYQSPQQRENNNNSRYSQQQNCQQQQQPWRSDSHNCYYCQKPGHIAHDCRRKIMNQNQGNPYQQPRYQQNMVQTNSGPSRPIPHGPAQSRPTPTGYPNQASYLGLMEDQSFDKSTPVEERDIEQISQPSKQTKSNIPPATITEDTTLAIIFPFDINNLNTHSLFSRAVINQDKPITALYTDARVRERDIKLILDSKSVSSIITKQLMNQLALVKNNWLSKANATLDWNTQELQLTFNGQHVQVPAMCGHFKNQHTKEPLIEFEDTSMPPTIETYQEKAELKKNSNCHH
ncbi:hypothetical protein G9A89_021149 [Geosiphon pyriformis]|nr:hypothetical protein G9A89_021149 [Geosiphon pyriformis]